MSAIDPRVAQRAAELRRAFDASFSEAVHVATEAFEDLLAIRVDKDPYAIRLAQLSGLFADRRIMPLPSAVPELLGIAGFRGSVIPVYDLRALLGYAGNGAPRWLAIAAGTPVAFAFDAFDGHLRVARAAIAPQDRAAPARAHVREVAAVAATLRPVVNVTSLLEFIQRRVQPGAPPPQQE